MTIRINTSIILFLTMFSIYPLLSFGQESNLNQETDLMIILLNAIKSGDIRYKLSEPEEITALLGNPQQESTRKSGGLDILEISYPDIHIIFGKMRSDKDAPFTILRIKILDEIIDIGQNQKLRLRNNNDLGKLDDFLGFQNVSLINLDLREKAELLSAMTFDSDTEWPPQERLPSGFDPQKLLAEGKNPGLGIRDLHQQGITGKGIGIAIIDQPLLLGHKEYTSRIIRYDATGLNKFSPQMHGSPIVSIAVGREIGVAPEATLSYFAVPMWEKGNAHYTRSLRRIFELNEILPQDEIIRVVSISTGMFAANTGFEEWQNVLQQAEAKGILVITCDPSFMRFGALTLIENKDPNSPYSYIVGKYCSENDVLRIPTGNKTIASHRGIGVYTYEREGGKSWAAPYIAGLAAMAFQINTEITPDKIKELLINTASKTSAGQIINPIDFIASVKIE